MPLYEVAALEKPTREQADKGAVEKIVLSPLSVVAVNEGAAGVLAMQEIKLESVDPNRLEVIVRPFDG